MSRPRLHRVLRFAGLTALAVLGLFLAYSFGTLALVFAFYTLVSVGLFVLDFVFVGTDSTFDSAGSFLMAAQGVTIVLGLCFGTLYMIWRGFRWLWIAFRN